MALTLRTKTKEYFFNTSKRFDISADQVNDTEWEFATSVFVVDKEMFVVESKKEDQFFYSEVTMIGSEEACKNIELTIILRGREHAVQGQ